MYESELGSTGVSIGVPVNVRVNAPFKSEAFRSNPHAEPMKKEMAGIPRDKPADGLTESKAGVPGVCPFLPNRRRGKGTEKYPCLLEPEKKLRTGVC